MTRQRSLVILLLAIASAGLAGFAAMRYTAQRPVAGPEQDAGTMQIVVAARDLPTGHLVTDADVQVIRWPAGGPVPAGYITQPTAAVGRGLIQAVRTNEPILEAELAERGSGGGMNIVFPEGMRAVAVRVDEVIAVAGYVLPQTRVDVLLTMKPQNATQTYTQTILQNVLVLTAGQAVHRDEKGQAMVVGVVTFMVTPEDGEKLVLAAQQGRIQLALRNLLDVDEVTTAGIGDTRLLDLGRTPARTASSGGAAPPRRASSPDSTVIEVFKGGVRSLQRF